MHSPFAPSVCITADGPCLPHSCAKLLMHACGWTIGPSGLLTAAVICIQDELFAALNCQPGFPCSRQELGEDLKTLLQ